MGRLLFLSALLCAACVATAAPKDNPLDQRVTFIAKAVRLSTGQTASLRQYTYDFEHELNEILTRFRAPEARAPFTKALISRFRNKIRILMTPKQWARFEALERRA